MSGSNSFKVLGFLACACLHANAASYSTSQLYAEKEWEQVLLGINAINQPTSSETKIGDSGRPDDPARLIAEANIYRDFRLKNPKSEKAGTAAKEEALALITAVRLGAKTVNDRITAIITLMKENASIKEIDRYSVVASWSCVSLGAQIPGSSEYLRQNEIANRYVISQFPSLPEAYFALLRTAVSGADSDAKRIAVELDSSRVPESVREEARCLRKKTSIEGRECSAITSFPEDFQSLVAAGKGRPIFVYTWTPASKYSMELAKDLAAAAPQNALIIGLALDGGQVMINTLVKEQKLPGTQIYCADRKDGFPRSEGFKDPADIWYIDPLGKVRSVLLGANLLGKIETFCQK